MGGKRRDLQWTWASRLLRGQVGRNPLRRACDLLETAVLAALVTAFLAAAPFAAQASGGWARAAAHQTQLQQEASRRPVPAVLLQAAAGSQTGGGYMTVVAEAPARWTAPDGRTVTGAVPVPLGTAAGASVRVWMTRDGQLTDPPLQDSQVADRVALGAVLGVFALATMIAAMGALARRGLDRYRMVAWDADWRATEPRWTTRA